MNHLQKLVKISICLLLVALTASCTGERKERAEPPRIALQSLKVDGTLVTMQLRVTNQSFGPMTFSELKINLRIAGIVASKDRVIALGELRVPSLGTEVLPFSVNSAELAVASNQPSLTYRLSGTANSERGEFPFLLDSILNQVPGSPGEFR